MIHETTMATMALHEVYEEIGRNFFDHMSACGCIGDYRNCAAYMQGFKQCLAWLLEQAEAGQPTLESVLEASRELRR